MYRPTSPFTVLILPEMHEGKKYVLGENKKYACMAVRKAETLLGCPEVSFWWSCKHGLHDLLINKQFVIRSRL